MSLTKELFLANLRKRGDANSETYMVQGETERSAAAYGRNGEAKTKRGRKTKTAESKTIFKIK
jgi:hypothetical protein